MPRHASVLCYALRSTNTASMADTHHALLRKQRGINILRSLYMITANTVLTPAADTRTYPPTLVLWAILGVVLIADVMDLLDSTLTNIAAPSVVRDLGGGVLLIKWLGSSYTLAMGVLLIVGGRLGDKYGQRRLFLIGQVGFTLASAICGLSVS